MVYKVNPFRFEGQVDYARAISHYELEPFEQHLPHIRNASHLMQNGIICASDVFGPILTALEKKEPVCAIAGMGLTGKPHLGTMLKTMHLAWLQKAGATVYIPLVEHEIASRGGSVSDARQLQHKFHDLLAATGLRPGKTNIYYRSDIPAVSDLVTTFYGIVQRGDFRKFFGRNLTPGQEYTMMVQAADMLRPQLPGSGNFKHILAVYGFDEMPNIHFANHLATRIQQLRREGHTSYPDLRPISAVYDVLVPGIVGPTKMGKSNPDAVNIYFHDSPKAVRSKLSVLTDTKQSRQLLGILRRIFIQGEDTPPADFTRYRDDTISLVAQALSDIRRRIPSNGSKRASAFERRLRFGRNNRARRGVID